ncbi:hypothetical protein NKJ81_32115 [Mesorhizobium sp. M0018]
MAVIFDEMEPEKARKAFLAAAKSRGRYSPQWQLANLDGGKDSLTNTAFAKGARRR